MENNISSEQLNKKERKELRRHGKKQLEENAFQRKKNKRIVKWIVGVIIVAGSIAALFWYSATRPQIPEDEIISKNGLHWHPELTITIKGQKQEIPANLGLGAIHQQIHTHDSTGVLHLEIQGIVRKDDTTLGRFFKIWGKEFNSDCIFDNCNGPEGAVTMTVNGKENTEFDKYEMKDKDKIEIRYE